jgi:hypothetical protein
MAFSISSNATGSEEMKRTERHAANRSTNSREARNCAGRGMRLKSSGTCLYGFIAKNAILLFDYGAPLTPTLTPTSPLDQQKLSGRDIYQLVTFPRGNTN